MSTQGKCPDCGCTIPRMNWKCWPCYEADKKEMEETCHTEEVVRDRLVGETFK